MVRALLRVGEAPTGYVLRGNGASASGFGADYERPGAAGLHLAVARPDQDTRRTDAHGCPVLSGITVTCTDDGGGRELVTYDGFTEWRELRLRRGGLVHTVSLSDRPTDLTAARHVLSTLRPATNAELSPPLRPAQPALTCQAAGSARRGSGATGGACRRTPSGSPPARRSPRAAGRGRAAG